MVIFQLLLLLLAVMGIHLDTISNPHLSLVDTALIPHVSHRYWVR